MQKIYSECDRQLGDISKKSLINEDLAIQTLLEYISLSNEEMNEISLASAKLLEEVRASEISYIDNFIQEFSLSNQEGQAIIALAESLLRIPDKETAMALLSDKFSDKEWMKHIGASDSQLVNASAFGLMLTAAFSRYIKIPIIGGVIERLGSGLILKAVKKAIKIISNKYILGNDLKSALDASKDLHDKGYNLSIDILGESSRDYAQAKFYYDAYLKALEDIKPYVNPKADITKNHNLSVKLTALHPKLLFRKKGLLQKELLPKLKQLILQCQKLNISISFDAEEAFRQDIYLEILTEILLDDDLKQCNGIGFVLQGYSKRAFYIIDYLAQLAKKSDKKIMIRLVKGAYWDSEIKFAQEYGLEGYPVFTKKECTDISYIACAKKIYKYGELFYPQFATHNVHTVSVIKYIFKGRHDFEFQRLQGMGEALHDSLLADGYKSRIYAPVGQYRDLLAYLMRRMLENGANTSFVNKMLDESVAIDDVVANPIETYKKKKDLPFMTLPSCIYEPMRANSNGCDLGYKYHYNEAVSNIDRFADKTWFAYSIINGKKIKSSKAKEVMDLCDLEKRLADKFECEISDLKDALDIAHNFGDEWSKVEYTKRAGYLRKFAHLLQEHRYELYALLIREAGKTIDDAIAEVREAIDFAYYYASQALTLFEGIKLPSYTGERDTLSYHPKGVFVCISPWNFPLAIFVGQILAALVTGNTVIAKSASNTCVIACYAISLMHKAGVDSKALSFVISDAQKFSDTVISSNLVKGVCFTGSNAVAKNINYILACRESDSIATFIAETGGQNAMIIDNSALLEQAADSIVYSAFTSAGQRCSALRVLYIQEDIYDDLLQVIIGSMNALNLSDGIDFQCDIGPVISKNSFDSLQKHVQKMQKKFNIIKHAQHDISKLHFAPHIIQIDSINDLEAEVFGPILHIVKYTKLDDVIHEINSTGFGLTAGMHSRIEERIEYVASQIKAGNFYANRTIIGAHVGTHPFGGEGKSGTGFKAGGPNYLLRFVTERVLSVNTSAIGGNLELLNRID